MEPNRQDDMMQNGRQRGRMVRAPDLNIRRSRVQIPFWPPADHDVVLGSPEFNFSSTLVNSQLVCLPPVGILNLVMFIWILISHCLHWSWKAPMRNGQLSVHLHMHTTHVTISRDIAMHNGFPMNFIKQTKSTQKISRSTKTQRRVKKQTFTSLVFWK